MGGVDRVCEKKKLSDRWKSILEKKTVIVDYGCALPTFLMNITDKGIRRIGVEEDKHALTTGRRNGVTMMTSDKFFRYIRDNSVDILRFSHVLEHTINPKRILEKSVRKLRNNGIIYITQPNFPVLKAEYGGVMLKDCVYPEHLHFFNPYSLTLLIKSLDLKIEKLISHTCEEAAYEQYKDNMDHTFWNSETDYLKEAGDQFFGKYCNHPYYCGENSYLIARKIR